MKNKETPRRSKRFLIIENKKLMMMTSPRSQIITPEPASSLSNASAMTVQVKLEISKKSKKPTGKRSLGLALVQKGTPRPTEDECRYATASLSTLHPEIIDSNDKRRKRLLLESCGGQDTITDSVIHTMLSQNTTDANKNAAWANLKKAFPNWDEVAECADIRLIENVIKVAGLAKTRAERMQTILRTVKAERGEASLDYIHDFSDEQIKTELSRFKGLGPKTISCVLLFALGRDEFPVDTHVLRIAQKMGWVSNGSSREKAYDYLNEMIPNDLKMDLHCLLVRHGKVCHRCAANGRPQFPPQDGGKLDCPLTKVSSWAGSMPIEHEHVFGLKAEQIQKKIKVEWVPDVEAK
jgi:endonuclease-3